MVALVSCGLVCVLHLTGYARLRAAARTVDRALAQQAVLFQLGLLTVLLALWPLDRWADTYLWLHMIQHLLLVSVACPLIVLGAPWLVVARAFPRGFRQRVGRAVLLRRWPSPGPVAVVVAFNAAWWLWHLPVLYDLAVAHEPVHYVEHATYLVLGCGLWLQLVGSRPWSPSLSPLRRAPLIFGTAVSNWVMSILLGFSTKPWYAAYDHPGTFGGLADQQLAAAVMWVGMEPSLVAAMIFVLHRWLREESELGAPRGTWRQRQWSDRSTHPAARS